jgi:meromycolic acid enoyl-[acyl-carrier protein] reductase
MSTATEAPAAREAAAEPVDAPLLQGLRIVVTGVLTNRSLAYAAAERMQELGAEIVLTGHGRARRLTERAASALPRAVEVLELDATRPDDYEALSRSLAERWDRVDGIFHSIAFAPPEMWDGPFFEVQHESVDLAMRASVYSLQSLTGALLPLLRRSPGGGSVVTMTVMWGRMSPHYAWMGVVKTALNGLVKHMAVELGPDGIRTNAVACGPVRTNAATGIPGFGELEALYQDRAPLGWDSRDVSVAADPVCFLLSKRARSITGEVVHVDGGYHAAL